MDMKEVVNTKEGSDTLLQEMFDAGLHIGCRRSFVYPKMKQYVFMYKGDLAIINLEKSIELWEKAFAYVQKLISEGKTIMLLGTQPAGRDVLIKYGELLHVPYMTTRWLGGTLTNFPTFKQRLQRLRELEEKIVSPEFSKYPKKEQSGMIGEVSDIKKKFDGLVGMQALPDAVFVFCGKRHRVALHETERMKIPVIGIFNLEDNPDKAAYPIVMSDNSKRGIEFVMQKVKALYDQYHPIVKPVAEPEGEKIEEEPKETLKEPPKDAERPKRSERKPSRRVAKAAAKAAAKVA